MKIKKTAQTNRVIYGLLAWLLVSTCLVGCSAREAETPRKTPELTYRETCISVGAEIDELLLCLGEDYTVTEAASCAGIGKDYVYTYPSLRLYVFAPEEGTATVISACYTDDGASHHGVTIGSAAEDVTSAIGVPDEQTDTRLVYCHNGVSLTFSLRDDRVSAVVLAGE